MGRPCAVRGPQAALRGQAAAESPNHPRHRSRGGRSDRPDGDRRSRPKVGAPRPGVRARRRRAAFDWRRRLRRAELAMMTIDPALYRDLVGRALEEDIGTGDVTTGATVDAGVR